MSKNNAIRFDWTTKCLFSMYYTRLWIMVLIWLVPFNGCMVEALEPEPEPEPEPKQQTGPALGTAMNNTLLLQLVNAYRTKGCNCGSEGYFGPVSPVVWNETLQLAAHDHCEDMFINKFFSHTGSDGSNPGTRLNRRNYAWSTYGENIAQGYQTEKDVIEGWMNSSGHCKNIMNPSFKEMGVSKSGNYWTQIFGTRRSY